MRWLFGGVLLVLVGCGTPAVDPSALNGRWIQDRGSSTEIIWTIDLDSGVMRAHISPTRELTRPITVVRTDGHTVHVKHGDDEQSFRCIDANTVEWAFTSQQGPTTAILDRLR